MATEVRLRDGTRAIMWRLLPEDREALREGYEVLSADSQYHRFLAPVHHLTDAMLDHLVDDVDGIHHIALVLFVLEDDEETGEAAGVGRIIRYEDEPAAADVAVTVRDEFQGRGVASALLQELLRERPVGVERIVTEVAADNPASLAMLRRLGRSTVTANGGNMLHVVVELPAPPAPGSSPSPSARLRDRTQEGPGKLPGAFQL